MTLSPLDNRLRTIGTAGVWGGLLAPLFFIPAVWSPYSAGKVWLFQTVVGLTFPAWLLLAWRMPLFRPPRTLLIAAVLAQAASIALSLFSAEDWHMGLWGTIDYMSGLVTHVHLAAWFVMSVTLLRTAAQWRQAQGAVLVVGLLSALGAVLQLAFPTILGQMLGDRVASFTGNPVFLGAYQVQLVFLAPFLWAAELSKGKPTSILALATTVVSLLVVVLTGSRGAVLALPVGFGVAGLSWAAFTRRWGVVFAALATLALASGAYLALAKLALPHPALKGFWERHVSLQHLFDWTDFSLRQQMWRLTLEGIADRPLLGWGQGNFEIIVNRHYDTLLGCEPAFFSDAHNLVLEVLSSRGVVGLLTMLLLWGVIVRDVIRAVRRQHLGALPGAILLGLLAAAPVPHLFNPESLPSLFMIVFTWAMVARLEPPQEPELQSARPAATRYASFALGAGAALILFANILPAYSSYRTGRAAVSFRNNDYAGTWRELQAAAAMPTPYVEEQLKVGLQLLVALAEQKALERFPPWRELLALDRQIAQGFFRHHQRTYVRLWWLQSLFKVGLEISDHALLAEADAGFRELRQSQPHRQEVAYRAGTFWAEMGRLDEAEAVLHQALKDDPRVGEAHYRYGHHLLRYRHDAKRGAAALRDGAQAQCQYLGRAPHEVLQVGRALARLGEVQTLRSMLSRIESGALADQERTYLAFARSLEEAGLIAERDRVLRLGIQRAPAGAHVFRRVLDGEVPRIADLKAPEAQPPASSQGEAP